MNTGTFTLYLIKSFSVYNIILYVIIGKHKFIQCDEIKEPTWWKRYTTEHISVKENTLIRGGVVPNTIELFRYDGDAEQNDYFFENVL